MILGKQPTERRDCRACHSTDLTCFFEMPDMPLANGFLDSPDAHEPRYPLRLNLCQQCGMVQLSHVVPAGEMFNPGYAFHTGSSDRMLEHFKILFVENVAKFTHYGDTLVEIGCNDALALCSFPAMVHKVGIDPAANPNMDRLSGHDLKIIAKPFTEALATSLDFKAKLIVACNVLGHVDDLDDFLRGVKALLHPEGVFVVEVPYFCETLANVAYDQVYSEHLSYFTVKPLDVLLNRWGLYMVNLEKLPVHGGTIRCTIRHGHFLPSMSWGDQFSLNDLAFTSFARSAESARQKLVARLGELRQQGKRIIGYGASAKGSVVLNFCGIGTDLVPVVIDSTPAKRWKFMPGTHQKIVPAPGLESPSTWQLTEYDAILLLAWNHAEEIKAKHPEFKGEWILPHG